jgi:hypothetical protein
MNDCSNAEIRDRLPDLLHDRLDVGVRAAIVAHVDGCVDCRDELELLRGIHGTLMAAAPRVDIEYVMGALPKAPARAARSRAAHRRWTDWRVAAGVTLLIAGGSSVALLNRGTNASNGGSAVVPVQSGPVARTTAHVAGSDAAPVVSAPANSGAATLAENVASADDPDASADVAPDSRFAGLNARQLETLLGEIDHLQPVPVTEPEPVTIKVDMQTSGVPDGLP